MSLSPSQLAARDGRLTASRVACLMAGDDTAILNLWRELVGDPDFVPDDLRHVWPVRLGECTEPLTLDWYAERTGRPVTRRGEVAIHPEANWAAATLDGWDEGLPGPVEAKHVGGREPIERIIERYQPQVQWQIIVTGAERAALSVIEAANEPVVEIIERDAAYAAELWRRAEAFMACVWSLTPPVAMPAVAPPVRSERVVDMRGSNEWGSEASVWLEHKDAAKRAGAAEKALKGLVPADALKAHGAGVIITRDKAGRLSLREQAA